MDDKRYIIHYTLYIRTLYTIHYGKQRDEISNYDRPYLLITYLIVGSDAMTVHELRYYKIYNILMATQGKQRKAK